MKIVVDGKSRCCMMGASRARWKMEKFEIRVQEVDGTETWRACVMKNGHPFHYTKRYETMQKAENAGKAYVKRKA